MIYLPRLQWGVAGCRLPLSGGGAELLVRALLGETPLADLTKLLSTEPGLVLWAICRSPRWQSQPPTDLEVIAGWLADDALQVLVWTAEELQSAWPATGELPARWGALAAHSVAAAHAAGESAEPQRRGFAFLCGLLSQAQIWLDGGGPDAEASSPAGLPVWLPAVATWREAAPDQNGSEPAPPVASCGTEPAAGARTADPSPDAASPVAATIRASWQNSGNAWTRLLPSAVNKLRRLAQLETEFQTALEREKLAALKELAYGASHEINNPLANISTRAQTLMREEPDPERRRKLAVINAQAFRAHEMISDMMLFARPPILERQTVDLTTLADRVIREVREDAAAQDTSLERVSANLPVTIQADPTHLAVALKALCTNSLEALRAGGRVEVAVRSAQTAGGPGPAGWVEIVVSDNGPGISPEARRHLFDPYFSGREAGRGLGLGLSKCWRIVTEHGGRIEVSSRPHRETAFTIRLPVDAPAPVSAERSST